MPALRLPPPIHPGDRIRLVAPSGVVDRDRLAAGLAAIERAGLVPLYDDGLFQVDAYLAGSDVRRSAELAMALADEDASAVWVVRGGYGCTRLLPALDVEGLVDRPRWLVGFSDVTALHAVWHGAGVATLHGANVSTLGRWSDEARNEVFGLLAGRSPAPVPGRLIQGEEGAEGVLLGGNLSVLTAMVGTGALPEFEGALLLLEDVDEPPYRIDRYVTQLKQAGVLDGVRGIVVGQLSYARDDRPPAYAAEALAAVRRGLDDDTLPILAHVPVGHEPSSWPVLLGVEARIEANGLVFSPTP